MEKGMKLAMGSVSIGARRIMLSKQEGRVVKVLMNCRR